MIIIINYKIFWNFPKQSQNLFIETHLSISHKLHRCPRVIFSLSSKISKALNKPIVGKVSLCSKLWNSQSYLNDTSHFLVNISLGKSSSIQTWSRDINGGFFEAKAVVCRTGVDPQVRLEMEWYHMYNLDIIYPVIISWYDFIILSLHSIIILLVDDARPKGLVQFH